MKTSTSIAFLVLILTGLAFGGLWQGGIATYPNAGVYAYLTSQTNTTITTSNTFTPILGTFSNQPIQGFSIGTNAIVYDGPGTRHFMVIWSASCYTDSNGRQVHTGVSIGGETLTVSGSSVQGTYLKTVGEPQTIAGLRVVELEPGDTIQLMVTSDDTGGIVTMVHFTTAILPFFPR